MSIIIFLIILAVLILAHEFGHFIVAKKSGILVEEFGIGFPPRIYKRKKGETTYSIKAIPFGGFVKMLGEDGETPREASLSKRSFASKPAYTRALVLISGVAFNILLAWVIISLNITIGMPIDTSVIAGENIPPQTYKVFVTEVSKNSPAEKAGILIGDEIIGFNHVKDMQNFIQSHRGEEVMLELKRGKESFKTLVVARGNPPIGEGAIGISMGEGAVLKLPWYKSILYGAKLTALFTVETAKAIFVFIYQSLRGHGSFDQVLGPVGIVGLTGTVVGLGFSYILSFTAFLSINLALLNIIPFPALDGGRLLFLVTEEALGKKISPKISSLIHSAGFAILLILMAIVTYKDILRLI